MSSFFSCGAKAPRKLKLAPPALLALVLAGCDWAGRFRLPLVDPAGAARTLEVVSVEPAPVLDRGAKGEFDAVDVLNPSVVEFGGGLWNFYSGFDGTSWHTGLARWSGGGWSKQGRVLEAVDYIAANGSAVVTADGEFLYWYQAGRLPQIGLARSRDGKNFQKESAPVLQPGPYRSWDERGVADPYVIRRGKFYYLYYTGLDRAQRQQLGLARSRDGVQWEKNAANPILELGPEPIEEGGLGEPSVFSAGGAYWMLYTGRAWDEQRRILLARSEDGVAWKRVPGWVFAGREAWNRKVVCDPAVVVGSDGMVRMWFGGGDVASPDERLNGKIGVATLRPM